MLPQSDIKMMWSWSSVFDSQSGGTDGRGISTFFSGFLRAIWMTCHKLISLDKSTPIASSGEEEEGGTRSENQHKHWEDNCQILQNVGTCLKMTINVIWFNDDYDNLSSDDHWRWRLWKIDGDDDNNGDDGNLVTGGLVLSNAITQLCPTP